MHQTTQAATPSLLDGIVKVTMPDGTTHDVLVSELLQLAALLPPTARSPSSAEVDAALAPQQ